MPELVTILRGWKFAVLLPVLMLGLLAFPVAAQDTKPDKEPDTADQPKRDGHDRPTTYPKIRFGKKAAPAGDAEAKVEDTKLKARVYLLDVSAVMSKTITVEGGRQTTRLEHMVAQMERSLDALAKRKDPRLRFNIVTFGTVQDFAGGEELQAATEENAKRAKEWLKKLEARGEADIYTMLKECYEQEPESATMIVGGMPSAPAGLDAEEEKELKKHKNAGEFVLEQLKTWRKEKKTTLDITGVALSADEIEFYKRLADAAGGTYLDA